MQTSGSGNAASAAAARRNRLQMRLLV